MWPKESKWTEDPLARFNLISQCLILLWQLCRATVHKDDSVVVVVVVVLVLIVAVIVPFAVIDVVVVVVVVVGLLFGCCCCWSRAGSDPWFLLRGTLCIRAPSQCFVLHFSHNNIRWTCTHGRCYAVYGVGGGASGWSGRSYICWTCTHARIYTCYATCGVCMCLRRCHDIVPCICNLSRALFSAADSIHLMVVSFLIQRYSHEQIDTWILVSDGFWACGFCRLLNKHI